MEDRAKYVLIGLFTFAVIAGAFGFVYWLHATSGTKDSAAYRVIFSGAVTGLRVGGPVLFNGIRVGEVSDLRLTDNPAEVAATLAVAPKTPIRSDTRGDARLCRLDRHRLGLDERQPGFGAAPGAE